MDGLSVASEAGPGAVLVINPLRHVLAHYEQELLQTLGQSGIDSVEIADTISGDRVTGLRQRISVAAQTLRDRMRIARSVRGRIIIVIWPLFGNFEPLTLRRMARSNTVYLIVHDPLALHRSSSQFSWTSRLFKSTTQHRGIEVLYHTAHAQQVGARANGVMGAVVPHPIQLASPNTRERSRSTPARPVVRVLGQYKRTRSLTALTTIADQAGGSCDLEIHGSGWPNVPGWTVTDRFLPEDEFAALVESSDCVVIAYDSFFQSGVAARCWEVGVPVVAPPNEHIAQLYGDDWAGTVHDASDWSDALVRALAAGASGIRSRQPHVANEIRSAWQNLLLGRAEVRHQTQDGTVEP